MSLELPVFLCLLCHDIFQKSIVQLDVAFACLNGSHDYYMQLQTTGYS